MLRDPLTQGSPAYDFQANPRSVHTFGSSGDLDGASFKFQQRARKEDAWVDNPSYTGSNDEHLAGSLTIVVPFNRLLLVGATASTEVRVYHDAGQ